MCFPLITDPSNNLYALGVAPDGRITTGSVALPFSIPVPPTQFLDSATITWIVTVDTFGRLVYTSTGFDGTKPTSIQGVDQTGRAWQIQALDTGLATTDFAPAQPLRDPVPVLKDISMSAWPLSIGVTCPACGNAAVTVSADLSCWCCTCSAFLHPEDTTILVYLDE